MRIPGRKRKRRADAEKKRSNVTGKKREQKSRAEEEESRQSDTQ